MPILSTFAFIKISIIYLFKCPNSQVREHIICLLLFIALYLFSYWLISRYKVSYLKKNSLTSLMHPKH